MTDPIADMLTRIRNGYMAKKNQVTIPNSSFKLALAEKLHELGYLTGVSVEDNPESYSKNIVVGLKYKGKHPVVSGLVRVSTPGRRRYTRANDVKPVLSGHGSALISTSKGIMSDKQAREAGFGGEIICKVW